jgi:hypothetical protein
MVQNLDERSVAMDCHPLREVVNQMHVALFERLVSERVVIKGRNSVTA